MPDHSPHANLKHQVSEVNVNIITFITSTENQVIFTPLHVSTTNLIIVNIIVASTKITGVFLFRIPQVSWTSGTLNPISSATKICHTSSVKTNARPNIIADGPVPACYANRLLS